MKFELSDEALLLVAGAGNALFAAHAAAAPKHFHNTYMSEGQTFNQTAWRWFAMPIACNASQNIVLAVSDTNKKALKNSLKAAGAGWLAASGFTIYNEGIQKREVGLANAAGMALLGGLCLYRGFRDAEE
ncbi:hypothetical protein ABPG77_003690 [Micractinium sp. CCAP 211/92]